MPLEIGSVHADGQFYDAARMLGAQQAFAPSRRGLYLRGLQPQVLALRQLLTLTLRLGAISGPLSLGQPSRARTMRGFNPSIAPAPTGLCPRCAYVATVSGSLTLALTLDIALAPNPSSNPNLVPPTPTPTLTRALAASPTLTLTRCESTRYTSASARATLAPTLTFPNPT